MKYTRYISTNLETIRSNCGW